MTDTTASILEAIISQSKSDSTSLTPSAPLFTGEQQPIYPLIRCAKQVHAEGPGRPGSMNRFQFPNAIDSGIHILESIWIEFDVTPSTPAVLDLIALKAIDKIEVRTNENVLLETLRGEDMYLYYRINLPTSMLSLTNSLASTSPTGTVQIPVPICFLKDTGWFPYLSLTSGFELRVYHSTLDLPTISRSSIKVWLQGYAIPNESFSLYQNKPYVLPITTIHSQEKVFEKGSALTEETFLLEDPRDLQELLFVMKPLEITNDPFQVLGPGTQVYDSLTESWIEIGTSRVTDPLRSQITRTIAFLQKHARVPELEEGIHAIPLSNIPQPSLFGFSTPGLMSHIQPKVNLKMKFDAIQRNPGDRIRYRMHVLMIRGQRLRIRNGKIDAVDESYGKPDSTLKNILPDPRSEINVDDPGSLTANPSYRPESTIGYLPRYHELTHEPFSRITRSHALKGSHAFGDLIVANIPLETDYLSDLILRVRLPQLPINRQWVNGIGYHLLDKITIRHEDIILFEAPGDAIFILDQQDKDPSSRIRRNANEYGYRSPDVTTPPLNTYRDTGSPDGYLRITIPWSFSRKGFPPLPTAALRDRSLEVQFRIKDIGQLVIDTSQTTLSLPQREALGGLRLTETLIDVTGYVLPHAIRASLMREARDIRCLQYRSQSFPEPDKTLRVIPIRSGLKRILLTSPTTSACIFGQKGYAPIQIVQVYSGSTKWYQNTQPPEFFEEWTRWRQGEGLPDIPLLCIDNRPGFINAARLDELRIQTTPGRLDVLTETEEFYRIQQGKIGPLFAD